MELELISSFIFQAFIGLKYGSDLKVQRPHESLYLHVHAALRSRFSWVIEVANTFGVNSSSLFQNSCVSLKIVACAVAMGSQFASKVQVVVIFLALSTVSG